MSENRSGLDNWDSIKPCFEDKNGNPLRINTKLKDLRLSDREALGIEADSIVIKDAITGAHIEIEPYESPEPVEITDNITGETIEI